MNLDDFAAITRTRIPTPGEFIDFVHGMGWSFVVDGDKAALKVTDAADPVAVTTARMLGREPYRTNVLTLLSRNEVRPAAFSEPRFVTCTVCMAQVSAALTPDDAAAICDRVPTRKTAGCPYREFARG